MATPYGPNIGDATFVVFGVEEAGDPPVLSEGWVLLSHRETPDVRHLLAAWDPLQKVAASVTWAETNSGAGGIIMAIVAEGNGDGAAEAELDVELPLPEVQIHAQVAGVETAVLDVALPLPQLHIQGQARANAELAAQLPLPDFHLDLTVGRPELPGPPAEPVPEHPSLDLMPWVGQRSITFRFLLFDGVTGIRKGEIHPVRDSAPTLTHSTSRVIKRSLELHLGDADTARVDTIRDRVQVQMVTDDDQVWPLGTYMFVNNPRMVSHSGRESLPALVDEMWAVDQELSQGFSALPGETVDNTLRRLLSPFGLQLDLEPTVYSAEGTWAPGARRGKTVEDLALQGDYLSPWMDHQRRLRFLRSFDPASRLPDFDFDAHPVVYRDSVAETDDLLEATNRWVVVSNASRSEQTMAAPIVGIYDLPDEAPQSAAQRGLVVPRTVSLPAGSTQQAAAMAANLGQRQALYEQVDLATAPDPRHDSYQVIRWDGRLWLEIGWSITLVLDGEMSHTLRRIYLEGGGAGA